MAIASLGYCAGIDGRRAISAATTKVESSEANKAYAHEINSSTTTTSKATQKSNAKPRKKKPGQLWEGLLGWDCSSQRMIYRLNIRMMRIQLGL